jgi:aldose 1-epimerase
MKKFQLTKDSFGSFEEYLLKNPVTKESVRIVSGFGCNIRELILKKGVNLYSVIEGHTVAARLKKKYSTCSFLIPFPGRIPQGKYSFEGTSFELPINKPKEQTAIHGLVYDKQFQLKKKELTAQFGSLTFSYTLQPSKGYPFSLEIEKTIILSKKGLEIISRTKNVGDTTAPYADGWHPYFSISHDINEQSLHIPCRKICKMNTKKVVTSVQALAAKSKFSFSTPRRIGRTNFDTCYTGFRYGHDASEVSIALNDISLVMWSDKSYPYVQVYIPPDRKSIALEPMTCAPNAFNTGIGLLKLKPGQVFRGSYGVKLE